MKVYAQKGSQDQIVLNDGITKKSVGLGADFLLMKNERPTSEHIAGSNGEWVLPESNLEINTNET